MKRCHLVCYAAGSPVHLSNRERLVASAARYGITMVMPCGPADIDPDFRAQHQEIFAQAEGGGFWLWKPYIILKALRAAAPGDIVVYVDSGAYLRRAPGELWDGADDADAVFFENDYRNRQYVKRDAFVLTNTDVAACHDAMQLDASLIAFRNTPAAQRFVENWLACCTDPRMVSDMPGTCGKPELPGFVAHRHDQSLLSLLLWRDGHELRHRLQRRAAKHRYIVHHRRRNPNVPIWWWHLLHDGVEAFARRFYDFDVRRAGPEPGP